jgi:hypothetical protein
LVAAASILTAAVLLLVLVLLLQVNDRIQLADEQVVQLQLAYQQFWRLLGKVQHKQQQQLITAIAESTTSLTEQQQQQQQQAVTAVDSETCSAAAAKTRSRRSRISSSSSSSSSKDSRSSKSEASKQEPTAAGGTAPVAAAVVSDSVSDRVLLEKLLAQHMAGWTAAAGLLLQFYCNTLTRLQIARMLMASFPFMPCSTCVNQHFHVGLLLEVDC